MSPVAEFSISFRRDGAARHRRDMSCSTAGGRSPPVVVAGRNVSVGGAPVFLKGVAWSPFNASRSPNLGHPPDFSGFVAQDAALMQAAGVNVVRTYAPTLDRATLDILWAHNIWVILTVFLDAGYGDTAFTAVSHVCSHKSHPAVLMWAVANEPNYYAVSATYESDIAAAVTAVQAADASRPVAVVL